MNPSVVHAYLDELLDDSEAAAAPARVAQPRSDAQPPSLQPHVPQPPLPPHAAQPHALRAPLTQGGTAARLPTATPIATAAPTPTRTPVAMPMPAADPAPMPTTAASATPRAAAESGRWLRLRVGEARYAFALLRVQEVVRPAPIVALRGAPPALLGAMNLRGRIVPVYDLGRWLGGAGVIACEQSRIVVVAHDDALLGVLVSAVDDVATIDTAGIEPAPSAAHAGALLGIARIAGTPVVLLDAGALFG